MNDLYTKQTYFLVLAGGIVKLSDWTEGSGRATRRKETPLLCKDYYKKYLDNYSNLPEFVKTFFEENTGIKGVVAFIGTEEKKLEILEKFSKKV